jgi:hypothetical protein
MINVRHLSALGLSLATLVLLCACDQLPTVPSGPYTVSGVVTEMTASGKVPIRGALVEENNIRRSSHTDASGRYRLAAMPAGAITIQVSGFHFEPAGRSVTVSGDTTADVDLRRREEFTLSGIVMEETLTGQAPLAGVHIEVVECPPQPIGADWRVEAETDINGFYSVSRMCDGVTAVWAWKTGYTLLPASSRLCGHDAVECNWVTIAGNTRFDFLMSRN